MKDEDLFRLLALASDVEGLVLEPSATAGFAVPSVVCGTPAGRAYLNAAGLTTAFRARPTWYGQRVEVFCLPKNTRASLAGAAHFSIVIDHGGTQ